MPRWQANGAKISIVHYMGIEAPSVTTLPVAPGRNENFLKPSQEDLVKRVRFAPC